MLNGGEVHDQNKRRHNDHHKAETDAKQTIAVEKAHLDAEEAEDHADKVTAFLKDPSAVVSRISDVMVWNGSSGQSVMMGLQALNESQARIGQAVEPIEKAQIVTNAALGSLQSLSMAALGISTLTGGMMLWRLNALNNRVSKLAETVIDVLNAVTAANHAYLNFAIQKLKEFDEKEDEALASRARDEAQFASSIYARLALGESQKTKLELAALNCASRYYLLSLLSEFQAHGECGLKHPQTHRDGCAGPSLPSRGVRIEKRSFTSHRSKQSHRGSELQFVRVTKDLRR